MSKTRVCAIFGIVMFACPANAGDVSIGETGYLRNVRADMVIVFKNQDAMSKVEDLRKAGADTRSMLPYVACIVANDTKILVTADITGGFKSGLFGTSDVTVIAGPNAGCRGVVDKEYVRP